jgi:methylphosphotriester-DNA--protein-cysteine methyltransferase
MIKRALGHGRLDKAAQAIMARRIGTAEGGSGAARKLVDQVAPGRGIDLPVATLTRACRLAHGRAPGEIALDRLLLEAMRMLTYTSAPVSRVADELGFSDSAYFARFFRGRTGMTASRFRTQRTWLGDPRLSRSGR